MAYCVYYFSLELPQLAQLRLILFQSEKADSELIDSFSGFFSAPVIFYTRYKIKT